MTVFWFIVLAAATVQECREMRLKSPVDVEVAEAQPRLTWRDEGGVYRLQVEARQPEGRLLTAFDTTVRGSSFRAPSQLTSDRATVKVRLSRGCAPDDGSRLRETVASFVIDTAPLCPGPVRVSLAQHDRSIEWGAAGGAVRYDVSLRRPDGTEIQRGEVRRPEYPIPANITEPFIAVVRPYCATGYGNRVAAFIEPPAR
jgi:hypothetical protein